MYQILAKINKVVLPSFSKKQLDLTKASKLQMLLFGWKLYVTKRAINQ